MVYKFKNAAHLQHLNAAACGQVLEALDSQRRLTPANVVEAARPDDSPLHPGFEWNDEAAALAYRLDQARYILRSIVVLSDDNGEQTSIRAFVTVTGDESPQDKPQTVYMGIATALADPVKRDEIIVRARRELRAWRERYERINEFADVFAAIEKATSTEVAR